MLLTPPPFVNADTTRTSPSWCAPVKSVAAARRTAAGLVLEEPERDVVAAVVLVLVEPEVHDPVARPAVDELGGVGVHDVDLAVDVVVRLHCQPCDVQVSLLPVANVVASFVQNAVDVELSAGAVLQIGVLEPVRKSRLKLALVNVPFVVVMGVFFVTDCTPAHCDAEDVGPVLLVLRTETSVRCPGTENVGVPVELEVQVMDRERHAARQEKAGEHAERRNGSQRPSAALGT